MSNPIHCGHDRTSGMEVPAVPTVLTGYCINSAACGASKSRHCTKRTIIRNVKEGAVGPLRGQDCGLKKLRSPGSRPPLYASFTTSVLRVGRFFLRGAEERPR